MQPNKSLRPGIAELIIYDAVDTKEKVAGIGLFLEMKEVKWSRLVVQTFNEQMLNMWAKMSAPNCKHKN